MSKILVLRRNVVPLVAPLFASRIAPAGPVPQALFMFTPYPRSLRIILRNVLTTRMSMMPVRIG